ncbi:MAG: hypothetical protein WBQ23_00210 [Bacteroidota bacterium]
MSDNSHTSREWRTAWFIVAVMVVALFWFASQAGWFAGDADESAAVLPAPAPTPAKVITQRRGLLLPIMEFSAMREQLDITTAGVVHENGINWLMLRLPVWTPSPRRFEYSSFELSDLSDIITAAHSAGMGVTLAPVYWDGKAMHTIPPVPVSTTLFGQYHDLLLDFADIAAESRADALLLDGLFGSTTVSATEWVDILAELRERYSGSIEGRMDEGHTPPLYLNQLDAAVVAAARDTASKSISSILGATLVAFPNKGVQFIMPDPDSYTAKGMRWKPMITTTADAGIAEEFLSTSKLTSNECRGFFLSGAASFEILIRAGDSDVPLVQKLQALREANLIKAIENARREQTITQ